MILSLIVCGLVVFVGGALFLGSGHDVNKMVTEFEDAFPGKCCICAYHAFGLREGMVRPGELPDDHRCPEKMDRWRGALHKPRTDKAS